MSSSPAGLTAIVAATKSNGIGLNGSLPWRLPGEMKYFAKVTTTTPTPASAPSSSSAPQNAVVMGRKTWESIPTKFRPLRDRQNMVISRSTDLTLDAGASLHSSLPSALAAVEDMPSHGRAFLIGGSQLYNLAFQSTPPLVNRVLLTRVLHEFECDTFLHDFAAEEQWERQSHQELCKWIGFEVSEENEEKGVRYRYEMWTLRSS